MRRICKPLGQQCLGRSGRTKRREEEIDRRSRRVDSSIEVKPTAFNPQGRKSLHSYWIARLRSCRLDSVAESSEFPDHSRSALLLRPFADDCATFLVTDSLVQDQPDQATMSMGDHPDGLIVPHARDIAAIDNLEDSSFGLYCGIAGLIENAPHMTVALRRPVAVVHSCALVIAGACAHP